MATAERGRVAALALFFALALAATGGILWFFFGAEADAPRPIVPPVSDSAESTRSAPAPDEATPVSLRGESPAENESPAIRTKAPDPGLVLSGRVTAESGEPLQGAIVRHVAVGADDLRSLTHDGFLFAASLEPGHFPPGPLRTAFAASSHGVTGEDGTYEFAVVTARGEEHDDAEVLVSAPGHAVARRSLTSESPSQNDFILAPAAAVTGTVRDAATGEPAAFMTVVAAAERSGLAALVPTDTDPRALSGPDGRYHLAGLPPGAYRVVPRTGTSDFVGHSLRQGREVVGRAGMTEADVDFGVSRGGKVSGRVGDGTGAALSGVTLTAIAADAMSASMRGDIEPYATASETRTHSDAAGRFEFRGLALGKAYAILASEAGFAPARVEARALTAAEPEADVEITLGAGSDLSGIVLDSSGAPAPRVKLTLALGMADLLSGNVVAFAGDRPRLETTSSEEGHFRFSNLPAGEYSIRTGDVNPYDTFDQAGLGVTVAVDGVASKDGVEVRMKDAVASGGSGVVAGLVKDDRGEPIEGATVKLSPEGGGFFDFLGSSGGASATTTKDGSFRARGLDPEKAFTVETSAAGHAASKLEAVTPGSPPLEIVLTRSASISGVVVTADGSPAPTPFTVRTESVEEGAKTAAAAIEDLVPDAMKKKKQRSASGETSGTFTIADIAPGLVVVVADVPGFAPARSAPIGLLAGESVTGITIRVSIGATVRGAVTLTDGSPVRMATVTARAVGDGDNAGADAIRRMIPGLARVGARDVTTGDDGRYEIEHLSPGRYTIAAEHPEYASSRDATVFLEPDETKAVPPLVLSTGGTIEGLAVDGPSGKGIAGLLVQVIGDGPLQMSTTDSDGKFRVERLIAGGYLVNIVDISAMSSGKGMRLKSKPVEIASDETVRLEIVFGIGAKVRGRVTGAYSKGGMQVVTLRRPGGPPPEEIDPLAIEKQMEAAHFQVGVGFVAEDGTYVIDDVEPGTYILELPVLPDNPLDFDSYSKMDRTPKFRRELTIDTKDVEVDIFVP